MGEILFDQPQRHRFKRRPIHLTRPNDGVLIGRITDIPQLRRIVIRPHEIKFHSVTVARFQKSIVQTVFQKRAPIVPIPIIREHVHTVLDGIFNLHFHHSGVCFILKTPKRLAVP